ncbi:hypothetical protein W03_16930 [Nitrosomonas sp. PY1]|uniref:hypothetical protein n=1 Tax=Nitrosomonas sp. PY1 TaxID=1803906 RepID=UPI001FC820E8|nr:hypothetical protein [Nitrosomonas sp. PY1]GKS69689.1 hypothetical protein W03_16930 [Nitrosomonas sp. PY1]
MSSESNTVSSLKVIENNKPEENYLRLDKEQRKAINRALLLGLASYAEIERLVDVHQLEAMLLEAKGKPEIPKQLRPIHPTGSIETLDEFVGALRYINAV